MAKKVKKVIPSPSRWMVERVDDRSGKWHIVEGCPSDFTAAQAFAEGLKLGAGLDASFVRVVHTDVPVELAIAEFVRRVNSRTSDDAFSVAADSDITTEGGDVVFTARVRLAASSLESITEEILRERAAEEIGY